MCTNVLCRNLKEDTGYEKRACFPLEKDFKQIEVRKNENRKGAGETHLGWDEEIQTDAQGTCHI